MKYKTSLFSLFAIPAISFAEEMNKPSNSSNSCFSSPMLWVLLTIIVLLLIAIVGLSSTLSNIYKNQNLIDSVIEHRKKSRSKNKNISLFMILMFFSLMLNAEEKANSTDVTWTIAGLDYYTFFTLLSIIAVEFIVIAILLSSIKVIVQAFDVENVKTTLEKKKQSVLIKTLTDAIPLEDEHSIALDHNYDGIIELDNNLPPWWKYGFVVTIIFAFIYMVGYHITGTFDLQTKEYNNEMHYAKLQIDEYMKNSANNVDENSFKYELNPSKIESGKNLFIANCAPCHGKLGEGVVGPNLTDKFWLHGGSASDVFKSVKYGWPDKGMKSWKDDFSPTQMADIVDFIHSVQGTNPPNAKEKQGDEYSDSSVSKTDSTSTKTTEAQASVGTN
ncbi:MAG: c-type cytochrome [Bacteroidetes bacterium]|nr:c-type cytochrome [Bacteroidota bacterium]